MKTIPIVLSSLLGFGSLAACGGDGDATVPCAEVCDKLVECDPAEDRTDCMDECAQLRDMLRGDVFDSMGRCMLDLPCESTEEQQQQCMEDAFAEAPEHASDRVLEAMCDRAVECAEGQMTEEECLEQARQEAGEQLAYMNAFKDAVLSCLTNCIQDLSCAEVQSEEGFDSCAEQCGIVMAEDATTDAP